MNKLLTAALAAAAVSIGTSAVAADMPVKAPSAAIQPSFNWSGFYTGIEGGWGRGSDNIQAVFGGGPSTTPKLHDDGGIAGGTLGYNWQSGAVVFGIEGDASWADIDPTGHDAAVFPTCTAGGLGTCGAKLDFLATARARLGFALTNNILVYGTGGGAFGEIKVHQFNTVLGPASASRVNGGWTAGGGIEVALGQNWSAKVEYLRVDLGNGPSFLYGGTVPESSRNWKADIVRVGLNYRFGDPAWGKTPVVAKY